MPAKVSDYTACRVPGGAAYVVDEVLGGQGREPRPRTRAAGPAVLCVQRVQRGAGSASSHAHPMLSSAASSSSKPSLPASPGTCRFAQQQVAQKAPAKKGPAKKAIAPDGEKKKKGKVGLAYLVVHEMIGRVGSGETGSDRGDVRA